LNDRYWRKADIVFTSPRGNTKIKMICANQNRLTREH
jgi:hypothetical protein